MTEKLLKISKLVQDNPAGKLMLDEIITSWTVDVDPAVIEDRLNDLTVLLATRGPPGPEGKPGQPGAPGGGSARVVRSTGVPTSHLTDETAHPLLTSTEVAVTAHDADDLAHSYLPVIDTISGRVMGYNRTFTSPATYPSGGITVDMTFSMAYIRSAYASIRYHPIGSPVYMPYIWPNAPSNGKLKFALLLPTGLEVPNGTAIANRIWHLLVTGDPL